MTPEFDKLVQEILTEAQKCVLPTTRQLSDKKGYRWMACVEAPYGGSGIHRVYWGRKDGSFNYKRCMKPQRNGTEAGMECRDFRKKLAKRIKFLRMLKKKKN